MSKTSLAQDQLLVLDPSSVMPLEVAMPVDEDFGTHPHEEHDLCGAPALEVGSPDALEIVVEELPGAPSGTKDPEPLEVIDTAPQVEEKEGDDANDAKKGKNEKWDWGKHGHHGFVAWIKERLDSVPKHSGYDTAGLERAMAYLDRVDNEISRAMRMDLDGELDANKIEEVRAKLDEGMSRLQNRLDKVKETKKSTRKRKKSSSEELTSDTLIKEAQKILGVQGVFIMAPLLISGLARICVNGCISAGHDIEDLYARQVKQWKLSDREQFELRQLLFDMGFVVRADRGAIPEEDFDTASSDNMDWAANYKG